MRKTSVLSIVVVTEGAVAELEVPVAAAQTWTGPGGAAFVQCG